MSEALRILLVDDEPSLLRLLQRHLQRSGHEVLAAATAEVALETLTEDHPGPDVLITDEVLPGMSGTELGKEVMARYAEAFCLLCSGYPLSLDAFTEAERQRLAILQKPYLPEDLDAAIARLTASASRSREAGSHGI